MKRTTWLGSLLVTAALVAGCGSPGKPVDPAPVGSVERPMPAGAGLARDVEGNGTADRSCDPTASLAPDPSIPPGSTMDEIRDRGYLVVGVDQNTFPFGFRNPTTGQLEGFDIDIAREITRSIFGNPDAVQFRAISSAQRIGVLGGDPEYKGEQVDIVVRTFSITCDRLEDINFSTVYYVAGQRVLVNENSSARGLGDLGGKRVCAADQSTSLQNIARAEPRPVPVQVDDWSDCLVLLQQGQVDAVSTDDTILAGMAQQDPTTKVVGERFTDELYGVGIPKDDEDMVRFVNAVLERVRAETWRDSYRRWGLQDWLGPAQPPAPNYR
ncbi:glutamate ABC transporter substrate-binding protein [Prauserella oleivorans]|uniref:Glutamate ABC transporter substrate-binding protein n=1 Tax=Prauserella oleivorans TaxID=1478153 RepID=A0ABW5W6U5_9PSEU